MSSLWKGQDFDDLYNRMKIEAQRICEIYTDIETFSDFLDALEQDRQEQLNEYAFLYDDDDDNKGEETSVDNNYSITSPYKPNFIIEDYEVNISYCDYDADIDSPVKTPPIPIRNEIRPFARRLFIEGNEEEEDEEDETNSDISENDEVEIMEDIDTVEEIDMGTEEEENDEVDSEKEERYDNNYEEEEEEVLLYNYNNYNDEKEESETETEIEDEQISSDNFFNTYDQRVEDFFKQLTQQGENDNNSEEDVKNMKNKKEKRKSSGKKKEKEDKKKKKKRKITDEDKDINPRPVGRPAGFYAPDGFEPFAKEGSNYRVKCNKCGEIVDRRTANNSKHIC